jgi:acyl carrier protein
MADTAEIILDWLRKTAAHIPHTDITGDTELIEQGILDSLQILNLVCFMEEQFAVILPVEEFVPENFRTAAAVAAMIEHLRAGEARSALNG